ncbi:DNA-binding HORMA [Penicillium cf. griseofulvum]|uniref:DNA-binding HORMA n=1 Tax=Penicillium cf. griseofulvum TaxID=2972120 RepID=A0A9W9MRW4_9EURO|nr:DNA-binding HORMA [Penicillium cf. griseofulvum]
MTITSILFIDTSDKLKKERPERSRRSRIPLNESEEEAYATCLVSRDGVHLSKTRRQARGNFYPAVYIRRLQDVGSKPIVTPRTVDYVKYRHGTAKKLDEENIDDKEDLPSGRMTDQRHKDWCA